MGVEVLGRDSQREAYRIAVGRDDGRIVGLVPDHTISSALRLTGGRGHQTAYHWLARHDKQIEKTLRTLRDGGTAPAPFDCVVLEED